MVDVRERETSGDSLLATSRGGLVSARGTSEGVVLRLDGRVPDQTLKVALGEFMEPRKSFLGGQEVSLEWIGVRPGPALVEQITELLVEDFGVTVRTSKVRDVTLSAPSTSSNVTSIASSPKEIPAKEAVSSRTIQAKESRETPTDIPTFDESDHDDDEVRDLFAGIDNFDPSDDLPEQSKKMQKISLADPALWDDPDARVIYSTLRSGQRIESEHSLIIIGDINPGAEVVAGGDVIVLGSLRGVAHAGAYDETGGGRSIFALSLQPTQLRIGTTISRGSSRGSDREVESGGKIPEIARVEGNMIVVEAFMKKTGPKKW